MQLDSGGWRNWSNTYKHNLIDFKDQNGTFASKPQVQFKYLKAARNYAALNIFRSTLARPALHHCGQRLIAFSLNICDRARKVLAMLFISGNSKQHKFTVYWICLQSDSVAWTKHGTVATVIAKCFHSFTFNVILDWQLFCWKQDLALYTIIHGHSPAICRE